MVVAIVRRSSPDTSQGDLASVQKNKPFVQPMAARPLSRASRATAARARRVRCDGLEPKIARLRNTSPPPNAAARQVPPSTLNIFPSGSRCVAASAAVHGAAAALVYLARLRQVPSAEGSSSRYPPVSWFRGADATAASRQEMLCSRPHGLDSTLGGGRARSSTGPQWM